MDGVADARRDSSRDEAAASVARVRVVRMRRRRLSWIGGLAMRAGARASSTVLDSAPGTSMDSPFEKLRENMRSAVEGITSDI